MFVIVLVLAENDVVLLADVGEVVDYHTAGQGDDVHVGVDYGVGDQSFGGCYGLDKKGHPLMGPSEFYNRKKVNIFILPAKKGKGNKYLCNLYLASSKSE